MSGNYNVQYEMKYTDNPYIDLLVRDTKNMAINSVVKNERDALRYETVESRRESDRLIDYKAGLLDDPSFIEEDYVELNNYYRQLAGLPPFPSREELDEWYENHKTVKGFNEYKEDGLTIQEDLDIELYRSKYVPLQRYKDDGSIPPTSLLYNLIGDGTEFEYLHEVQEKYNEGGERILSLLDPTLDPKDNQAWEIVRETEDREESSRKVVNVLDIIKQDYTGPDFKYIYHLGEKAIDPYTARMAEDFTLLYCPKPSIAFGTTNTEYPIYYKYLRYFDRNRLYTITAIYSDAYAVGSEHYEDFLIILIILQTMVDMITEVQEYIINKDIFDSRTIRYLFESYGIEYYKEIPMVYQVRLIKNINEILKYKSTNKNIKDIINLFVDHVADYQHQNAIKVEVFTYWILKSKKVHLDEFQYITQDDVGKRLSTHGSIVTEDMVGRENFVHNYDLEFIRVPISDQNAAAYIEDKSLRRTYDYITKQDPFWDGVNETDILTEQERENYHNKKKTEILEKDFSYERTKYLAVDAAIDVSLMSYQMSYFFNILFDKHDIEEEDKMILHVDSHLSSNGTVRLSDLLVFMIAMGYIYNGVQPDNVAADIEKNMFINGFNFDTDWTDIYNDLVKLGEKYGYSPEQLLDPVIGPDGEIVSLDDSFLCGRYEADLGDPGSAIWTHMKNFEVVDFANSYYPSGVMRSDGVWYQKSYFHTGQDADNPTKAYPAYLKNAINAGTYSTDRIIMWDDPSNNTGVTKHLIDITWPIQTPNTHARFVNTSEFAEIEDSGDADDMNLKRINKLKEIYLTNTKLYNHITYMMKHAESKRMYEIYHTVYKSYMEMRFCHEFFNLPDGTVAPTYLDWMEHRDSYLFEHMQTVLNMSSKDDQRVYINILSEYAVLALEEYFDSDEWSFIYNIIPTHNQQFIRDWIMKLIIFFKSWKTQILDPSTSYIIDDSTDERGNYVHILDDAWVSSHIYALDKVRPVDYLTFLIRKVIRERVDIFDRVKLKKWNQEDNYWYQEILALEKASPLDHMGKTSTISPRERVGISDTVKFKRYYTYYQATALDFLYSIDNGEVRLIRYLSDYARIRLPETIEGYPCTMIEATCFSNDVVIEVEVPPCYKYIY